MNHNEATFQTWCDRFPEICDVGRLREAYAAALASAPVADERAAFEAKFPPPSNCQWIGNGYAATDYNAWSAHTHKDRWEGWQARAALASAPVAGDAQPTDAEIIDLAVEPLGIDCDRMPHGVVVFARNLLSRYAAPQASTVGGQAQAPKRSDTEILRLFDQELDEIFPPLPRLSGKGAHWDAAPHVAGEAQPVAYQVRHLPANPEWFGCDRAAYDVVRETRPKDARALYAAPQASEALQPGEIAVDESELRELIELATGGRMSNWPYMIEPLLAAVTDAQNDPPAAPAATANHPSTAVRTYAGVMVWAGGARVTHGIGESEFRQRGLVVSFSRANAQVKDLLKTGTVKV